MNSRNRDLEDCPESRDGRGHCQCWWDCDPCCWCSADEANEECDCPKHRSDHLGFTGTAEGMTEAQLKTVDRLVDFLRPTWIHHGDCLGSDDQFHEIGWRYMISTHVHPPSDPKLRARRGGILHPERPYLKRNQDIVDASDLLLATPRGQFEELRSGTWATVRYARKKGIPIIIVYPNGLVRKENIDE